MRSTSALLFHETFLVLEKGEMLLSFRRESNFQRLGEMEDDDMRLMASCLGVIIVPVCQTLSASQLT